MPPHDDLPPTAAALRCALCGGPLGLAGTVLDAGGTFDCPYCGSANLVESRATRLVRRNTARVLDATEEAREMYAAMEPRMRALEAELSAAYLARDLARALHAHEALLRLVSAPQVHILRAADPSEAWVQRGYRELDAALAKTLANVREEWRTSGRLG